MAVFSPSRTFRLHGMLFLVMLIAPFAASAQTAPTNPQKPCTAPCTVPATPAPDTPDPAPSKKFPYPGESKPASQSSSPDVPDAPSGTSGTQTPAAPGAAPSKQFPYPGESHPADTGGSSSSSSSSSDSPDPAANPAAAANADDDTPTDKFPRRRLPKVRNLQTDEERESEDLTVAKFYRSKGNWNAAYLRSKDAVKHGPDDPDAHLLLAESALKLNKKDEAAAEYNALLKLDASEEQVKTAHKALERLK
ncbi:MAG: Tetratricopeptide 2 repeat-containing protein [Acidobacteriaceae bacterium]|nr:Tetratricopeptide 2 repeat-containing protein [Acidobacteriaceae bacterium]